MLQSFSIQLHMSEPREGLGWDVDGVDPDCSPLPAPPTGLLSALPDDQADRRSLVSVPG